MSLPPSLEWQVWSSSSGNNCHAVHRSLSSGESVCDSTAGFYLVPYCQPSLPTRFVPITGHRNVSPPLSLEWHVWPSRRSIYNTNAVELRDQISSSVALLVMSRVVIQHKHKKIRLIHGTKMYCLLWFYWEKEREREREREIKGIIWVH